MKLPPPILLAVFALACSGWSKDARESGELDSTVHNLHPIDSPRVLGIVTLSETKDGTSVLREINVSSADIHPAFMYGGDETGNGVAAIVLNPIECNCESSITTVNQHGNGKAISFRLKAFDGHVKIHPSSEKPGIVIALGNIGANKIIRNKMPEITGNPGIGCSVDYENLSC